MWLGVTQGHRQHNHSIECIRLPIRINRNYEAITWHCLRDPMFSRFDTIPACDRQTHGSG